MSELDLLPTQPRIIRITLVSLFALILCQTVKSTVVINEFMASNRSVLADEDGNYGDWIEIHNRGDDAVMLHGWALSDDPERPFRWRFPPVAIPGGGYLLVWATGKDRRDPAAPLHTNFSIASVGEPLRLSRPDGSIADEVDPVELPRDISYGRGTGDEADGWFYFPNPTPGLENHSQAYEGLLDAPTVTVVTGAFGDGATVTINHPREGVSLYYTLDGSRPDENSKVYQGPFWIEQPYPVEDGLAWIPTSPPEMAERGFPWLPPKGPVQRIAVIKAKAFKTGQLSLRSGVSTWQRPSKRSDGSRPAMVSLVSDATNLFDNLIGIYVPGALYDEFGWVEADWDVGYPYANYHQRGPRWERPVHFEFFPTGSTVARTSGHLSMRIHGASSRILPQKSLRLYDRFVGTSRSGLQYPFFGGNAMDRFQTLVLRNSGQDLGQTHLRDALAHQLVAHLRFGTLDYLPVEVFLNGEYWGLHNLRERFDWRYLYQRHGTDADNLDIITFYMRAASTEGDLGAYNAVIEFIDANDTSSSSAYHWLFDRIDIDNHIDYHIAQIFLANRDWKGNNVDIWRVRTDGPQPRETPPFDGRLRWFMADLDFALGTGAAWWHVRQNMLEFATNEVGENWPNPAWATTLFRRLLANQDYRDAFVLRFADLLNSSFLSERTLSFLDTMIDRIEPAMARQIHRWSYPASIEDWNFHLDDIAEFLERRPAYQWDHLRDFFGLGPLVEVSIYVDESTGGYTRLNSLELRPKTVGLETFGGGHWSGMYPAGYTIEVEAVAHPGYRFEGWTDDPGAPAARRIKLTADISLEPRFSSYPGSLPDQPHVLIEGPYTFRDLSPNRSPGTRPPSLRFPLSPSGDPGRNAPLGENIWTFPYDLNNRSRVVGLGDDGVAFINTGNAQNIPGAGYVMGALLALDTRGVEHVYVGWSAGTIRPNNREYALRLQYRVGAEGPFRDVVDAEGQPFEYIRQPLTGHTVTFPASPLPPDAVGVPYVELLWRYYDIGSVDSGPRAKLSLDDIIVTATPTRLPPHAFWSAFAEIEPGTFRAPPFGAVRFAEKPWVDTENFGLLAVIEEGAGNGAFIWSESEGWLWTEPRALPYVLRLGEAPEWFSPAPHSIAYGWSFSPETGEWLYKPGP